MLFYPRDYWHQTLVKNRTSVSITGTLVDVNNRDSVGDQLYNDCFVLKRRSRPSDPVCKLLANQCRGWWEDAFAGEMTATPADATTPRTAIYSQHM